MDLNLSGPVSLLLAGVAGFGLAGLIYVSLIRVRVKRHLAEELKHAKNQFVGMTSHYLLTPITIIQTAVARLQEGDTGLSLDERRRLYRNIEMGQQRLWILAEQMVMINEIEEGNLQLNQEVINLPDLVSSAVTAVDVFVREKNVQIKFFDNTKETRQVRGDQRRLKQALIAILDNAIKFSMPERVVQVQLDCQDGLFLITVTDEGVGMDNDVLERVSEKFYRGNDIYAFDYQGMGLGLFIASSIMKAHQGTLSIESHAKRGTVVQLQIPNL